MKEISISSFFIVAGPRLVALITSGRGEGANAMAATWHSPISFDPPLYGVSVSPERASHSLIRESGSFGISLVSFEMVDAVHTCGRVSRRERADKVRLAGLELFEGPRLGVPLVRNAYAAIECELVNEFELGDHTWFVGYVRSVLADGISSGILDLTRVKPLFYLGEDRYVTVDPSTLRRGVRKA